MASKQTAVSPLSSLVTAGWSTVIKPAGDGPKTRKRKSGGRARERGTNITQGFRRRDEIFKAHERNETKKRDQERWFCHEEVRLVYFGTERVRACACERVRPLIQFRSGVFVWEHETPSDGSDHVPTPARLFFPPQQPSRPEMSDGAGAQVIQAGDGRTLSRWVPAAGATSRREHQRLPSPPVCSFQSRVPVAAENLQLLPEGPDSTAPQLRSRTYVDHVSLALVPRAAAE